MSHTGKSMYNSAGKTLLIAPNHRPQSPSPIVEGRTLNVSDPLSQFRGTERSEFGVLCSRPFRSKSTAAIIGGRFSWQNPNLRHSNRHPHTKRSCKWPIEEWDATLIRKSRNGWFDTLRCKISYEHVEIYFGRDAVTNRDSRDSPGAQRRSA